MSERKGNKIPVQVIIVNDISLGERVKNQVLTQSTYP